MGVIWNACYELVFDNNSDVVGNIAEVNEGGKRGMPLV